MPSQPKVSVCVPTFNGESFLEDCVQSILVQSDRDFELLIVDDGSSDSTVNIASKFAELDSRVKLVVNPRNLGLVENWNRCVSLAKGQWIKFVFQDDLLTADCIEKMLQAANSTGRQVVFCMRDFIFDSGVPGETVVHYRALPTLVSVCAEQFDIDPATATHLYLTQAKAQLNFFGEPTCALIHRDIFESHGLFDPHLIQFCDLEYWLRVASNVGFAWCPQSLASFRVHGASTSQRNASRKAFRSSVLDRLVMGHQFAYAPAFASFRRTARRHHGLAHYQRKLAHDAFWAMNYAKASTDEPGLWLDWEAVAEDFPRLRSSFWQLPLKAQAWAERNVLWRWRRASHT